MKRLSLIIISAALSSACTTVGPDYERPVSQLPVAVSDLSTGEDGLFTSKETVAADWWTLFEDPTLNALIEQMRTQNTDLRVALARLDAAQIVVEATSRRGLPRIGGRTNAQRIESSTTALGFGPPPGAPSVQNLFEAGVSASWEIDTFGRIARRVEAADANAQAVAADVDGLILALQAETISAYLQLRSLQDQLAVSKEAQALAQKMLDLTIILEERELASEFDTVRVRAELADIIARQERLVGAQRATIARLAVLTGTTPNTLMSDLLEPENIGLQTPEIPIGLPSELVRRRPDIQAAERRLAAATADIGAETADLFPSFNLTGGLNVLSADTGDLFEGGSTAWSLGGFINWPIFDGGVSRAEIKIAEANAEAALAQYDGAIIAAFADVEASLSTYVYAVRELRGLKTVREDRQRAYDLAELRYRSGADSLFSTLDAQRQLITIDADIALSRANVLQSIVAVHRALGGGWSSGDKSDAT